jgi:hypothetical protein
MKIAYIAGLFSALIAVPAVPAAGVEGPSSTLVVTTLDDSVELAVPLSRLILTFPRGGLTAVNEPRLGAAASARNFHFYDGQRGLVVSGWFEPA